MKIIITDKIDLVPEHDKVLRAIPDIKVYDDTNNDPKVIIKRIKEAEVATANYIDFPSEVLKQAKKLKYVIVPAVGYDWVDVKEATEQGIKVINCPSFNSQAVAEHAIGLMLAVKRRIVEAHNSILEGKWTPKILTGTEVMGKHLVTVGYGNIGKRVCKLAEGLGMSVAHIDSETTVDAFDMHIAEADVLVLCLPLNDSTKGIINRKRISLLKPNVVLINVARGLVVDQDALYEALTKGNIAGAGIDVFPNDNSITKPSAEILKFAKLSNVVATPHLAYNTEGSIFRLGEQILASIQSCIDDKPINVVN